MLNFYKGSLSLWLLQVHRVFSRGIAGLEGTIQRGDNIISISGTPLGGASHGDALSVLHQARLPKQALVVIRRGKESEPLSSRQEVPASGGRQSQSTRDVTMETGTGGKVACSILLWSYFYPTVTVVLQHCTVD